MLQPAIISHIVLGVLTILIGGYNLYLKKSDPLHPKLGEAYHWLMLATCISALLIGLRHKGLSPFEILAYPSYGFALLGYVSAKMRFTGWLRWHITGQGGSYIALWTATLFQLVPRLYWSPEFRILGLPLMFWLVLVLPGVIGGYFIGRTQRKWAKVNWKSKSTSDASPVRN